MVVKLIVVLDFSAAIIHGCQLWRICTMNLASAHRLVACHHSSDNVHTFSYMGVVAMLGEFPEGFCDLVLHTFAGQFD